MDKYKIFLILFMEIIAIIFEIFAFYYTSWSVFPYIIFCGYDFIIFISSILVNIVIRSYYLIKYKQKFELKNVYKKYFLLEILIMILLFFIISFFIKII